MSEIQVIIQELVKFRDERNWKQFHDSKNLALGISIEAAELNELFLWKKDSESEKVDKELLKEELADVFAFSFLLAEKHKLNVKDIIMNKIKTNSKKYPIKKSKGISKKYNEL
jgi:NTP pyrophosphatase (non-canonical NTP hydrolase)